MSIYIAGNILREAIGNWAHGKPIWGGGRVGSRKNDDIKIPPGHNDSNGRLIEAFRDNAAAIRENAEVNKEVSKSLVSIQENQHFFLQQQMEFAKDIKLVVNGIKRLDLKGDSG